MPAQQSITDDGLVAFRHIGGPARSTIVPDLAIARCPWRAIGVRLTRSGSIPALGTRAGHWPGRRTCAALERDFRTNHGGDPASSSTPACSDAGQCERVPHRCDLAGTVAANDKANTLTFHFAAPDPEFLYQLALPFADAVAARTPDHPVGPPQLPATG